jgi:6-phosphogluconolactonase
MTNQPGKWTRRQFSQLFAATAASSLLVRGASASAVNRHEGFAFVGSSAADSQDGLVRVYRVSGATWQEVHALQAASPAHLVMHPTLPVLYVVHDVAQWDRRPRGAVSAYHFDSAAERLTHAGTQPLSLSATNPRHAVITAGAQALFVAAESGGIYNLLPIAADGTLLPVSAIRKEFGLQESDSAKTSAPRHVVLHADGSVYAADPGQETITRFATSGNAITVQHRTRVHHGAGASQLTLSSAGHVYALNSDSGAITVHSLTTEGLSSATQTIAGVGRNAAMQMHPDGRTLAVSNDEGLQILRVHPRSGRLTPLDSVRQPRLQQLQFAAVGTQVAGIQAASGKVVTHAFDAVTGELSSPRIVAQVDGSSSLLVQLS